MRITTLNILHDSVRSWLASWRVRRPRAIEMLRSLDADVIGLQEVSTRQLEDLRADLFDYDLIAGAAGGPTRLPRWAAVLDPLMWGILGEFHEVGEFCPLLLRRGVIAAIEHGSFILGSDGAERERSPTPHVVTWARIRDARAKATVLIYNSHLGLLPWRGAATAHLLNQRLDRDWDGTPQLLMGDFNAVPGGPLLRLLQAADGRAAPPLRDLWREARARAGEEGTFHWGFGWKGPRIDYILARPPLVTDRASTTAGLPGGRFPSDHRALTVDLTFEV